MPACMPDTVSLGTGQLHTWKKDVSLHRIILWGIEGGCAGGVRGVHMRHVHHVTCVMLCVSCLMCHAWCVMLDVSCRLLSRGGQLCLVGLTYGDTPLSKLVSGTSLTCLLLVSSLGLIHLHRP